MTAARYVTLSALVALVGCGPSLPTAPSGPPPTPPPPVVPPPAPNPVVGEISVRSIVPGPGASFGVRDCTPPGNGEDFKVVCSDGPRMTFDVVINRDIPAAILTVGFYDGNRRCGMAYSDQTVVAAGTRFTLNTDSVDLSEEGRPLICNLPATTTTLRVQLWSGGSMFLTQDFNDVSFSFTQKPPVSLNSAFPEPGLIMPVR